jgi:hypothetical protein
MLIHQLPPKPDYVRVKVRRRLHKLGAVLLKNSVYVLPESDGAMEDLQWLSRAIAADGGSAVICRSSFVSGVSDADLEVLHRTGTAPVAPAEAARSAPPKGATWVTRRDVGIDRIGCAWLIKRFIDRKARFKFVANDYTRKKGELRFDMYRGEYTHVGDNCSFETLLTAFALTDRALVAIGEIVHDLDCKDDKFERPEAPGVGAVIRGIASSTKGDAKRLTVGAAVFDGLYDQLRAR